MAVALAKLLRPETVSAVAEALLNDAVEVEVIDPTVSAPPIALSKKSEEIYAVVVRSMEEKRLVEVALMFTKLVIHELVEVD